MMDRDLFTEYERRLAERYTAVELVEILDIPVEEILAAFEPRWMENRFLLEEVGMIDAVYR